jgi:hypothetical protein
MTDVLDRMRRLQKAWQGDSHGVAEAFGQAADEIEKLRAEVEKLRAQVTTLLLSRDIGRGVEP